MVQRKRNTKTVPVSYDPVNEIVAGMAKKLIAKFHDELINSKIAYLFKNKPMTQKGKAVAATAEKVGDKMKALCEQDFLIVISYPTWQDLTDKEKWAVLDHELQHCFAGETEAGDAVHKILDHDFSDFGVVIQRHGFYGDLSILRTVLKEVEKKEEQQAQKGIVITKEAAA